MQRWLDGTLGSRKFVKIPEGFLQRAAGRELEYADDRLCKNFWLAPKRFDAGRKMLCAPLTGIVSIAAIGFLSRIRLCLPSFSGSMDTFS